MFAVMQKNGQPLNKSQMDELPQYLNVSWIQRHEDWEQVSKGNYIKETNLGSKSCMAQDFGDFNMAENII